MAQARVTTSQAIEVSFEDRPECSELLTVEIREEKHLLIVVCGEEDAWVEGWLRRLGTWGPFGCWLSEKCLEIGLLLFEVGEIGH